jgi:creatinine amidohydrolase/Fe(II)-dependent formamide hydrolase-like protein
MDVREAIRGGTTTIIIGTGGVEQTGPYVAGGKHNFVLQTVLPYIAREIGHALIAPIVKFVPEGDIEPTPTGHMAVRRHDRRRARDVRGAAHRHLPELQSARVH